MSLWTRFINVLRSNANDAITRAEDPAKMLNQMVTDMEEHLRVGKMALIAAIAEETKAQKRHEQNLVAADEWDKKAKAAADKDEDNLALEALKRRNAHKENALAFGKQWEQQKTMVAKVRNDLLKLESRIEEAKTKKEILIARQQSAEAIRKINEQLGGIGMSETAFETFERMEAKVEHMEAISDATERIKEDTLQMKFDKLKIDTSVEEELAQLKAAKVGVTGE